MMYISTTNNSLYPQRTHIKFPLFFKLVYDTFLKFVRSIERFPNLSELSPTLCFG